MVTGVETARLKGHGTGFDALVALPDGRVAAGSRDCTIRLWDATTGAETACLEGHTEDVTALAVLGDDLLASGSGDGTIRVWDLEPTQTNARIQGHDGPIQSLVCLPNGLLFSKGSGNDQTNRLWNVETATEIARTGRVFTRGASVAGNPDFGVWASPNGRVFCSPEWNTQLLNLSICLGSICLATHDTPRAVLADGRVAVFGLDSSVWDNNPHGGREDVHEILLMDTTTGAETARLDGHEATICALLVDGRLASGSKDKTIRLWDVERTPETGRLEGHGGPVNALAVLPDGRLVSASGDNTVRLWDTRSGAEVTRLEVDAGVLCLATLSNDRIVAGDALGRLHWLEIVE